MTARIRRAGPLLSVAVFLVIGAVCAMLVANTLRAPVRGSTVDYTAEFTDVEGLLTGDPVTLSGVRIGRVSGVDLTRTGDGADLARVRLEVMADRRVSDEVEAVVRYGDMLGARYVELVEPDGIGPDTPRLADGGLIPVTVTTPPVDLTALMNGFAPLFDALEPERADALARGFVEVFNGRGEALARMQELTADLTGDLVARGPVVEAMIADLAVLAETVDGREDALAELTADLSELGGVVVGDGDRLTAMLDDGAQTVSRLAAALEADPGAVDRAITDAHRMTAAWLAQTGPFVDFLSGMPAMAEALGRATSYGGFVNLYLCTMHLEAGDLLRVNMLGETHSPVCR